MTPAARGLGPDSGRDQVWSRPGAVRVGYEFVRFVCLLEINPGPARARRCHRARPWQGLPGSGLPQCGMILSQEFTQFCEIFDQCSDHSKLFQFEFLRLLSDEEERARRNQNRIQRYPLFVVRGRYARYGLFWGVVELVSQVEGEEM